MEQREIPGLIPFGGSNPDQHRTGSNPWKQHHWQHGPRLMTSRAMLWFLASERIPQTQLNNPGMTGNW